MDGNPSDTRASADAEKDLRTVRIPDGDATMLVGDSRAARPSAPDATSDATILLPEPGRGDVPAKQNAPVTLPEESYAVGGEIARGGMGSILEAEDRKLSRKVAMKVMRLDASASEDARSRFVREATVLARLEHPNIVPIHELGWDAEGRLFYTMKLVQGRTLQAILNGLKARDADFTRQYTLDRLLTIFRKICDALSMAHAKGVIHRDLKPENVMVGEFGEVLVMDWGIAKILGDAAQVAEESARKAEATVAGTAEKFRALADDELRKGSAEMTMDGTVMGTPHYMSPEQAEGHVSEIDQQSDVFSLGAILYALLTLHPPVEASSIREVLARIRSGDIRPPTEYNAPTTKGGKGQSLGGAAANPKKFQPLPHCPGGRVPAALSAVTMRALTVDKAKRYPTVAVFAADIEAYQGGFATSAENAGVVKQLALLIKRHKALFGTAAAAWLIITALAVWFVISIKASEGKATRNAELAAKNAQEAKMEATRAIAAEKQAEDKEREAVAEKENVRRALAKSALALAEAAYREADGPAMQSALDQVPADLRDANWSYLLEQSDTSVGRIGSGTLITRGVTAHPKQPSVFAIVSDKQEVIVLNARTGERLLQFKADLGANPSGTTFPLAFSPDGERIAVGQSAGIAIHSIRDGTRLLAIETGPVLQIQFSPDGRHLLQLRKGKAEHDLWDATTGKLVWSYRPDTTKALRGAVMPDGKHVLTRAGAGDISLLNMADGTESRTIKANPKSIDAFAVRPDGVAALWGDTVGDVHCVELGTGQMLFSTRVHSSAVRHAAFLPDGSRFVSVSTSTDGRQSIRISDANTGALLQSLLGGAGQIRGFAVHPVSGELLIAGQNSRLWDLIGTPPAWSMRSPSEGPHAGSAVFLGSDNLFLGPTKGLRTSLHDLSAGSIVWNADGPNHRAPAISVDNRTMALAHTGKSAGRIQVLEQSAEKQFVAVSEFEFSGELVTLRMNRAGDRLCVATTGISRKIAIFDRKGQELTKLDRTALQDVNVLGWIAGTTNLLGVATANKPRGVTGSEERIIVWDAASGRQVRSVVHPTALDCLVVAPDGKSFAAAGADKLVHVFDTETLAERQAFRAHDGPITALAWHPARPIVATGSADLTIKVWNLESGRRLEILRGPTAAPRVLNFSPSGQRLACASEDRMVRIWEPKPLQNAVLDAPDDDGWEDLLAKLKADEVKANGNGWTLSGGLLLNPKTKAPPMVLPGSFARTSYTVSASVRELGDNLGFSIAFPVGERQAIFELDYHASEGGYRTGLGLLGSRTMKEIAETVTTRQVNDSEQHDLEITVQLGARTAKIAAALDGQAIYEWSGPVEEARLPAHWPAIPPATIALGWNNAGWIVSAVKVKRL